jgi:Mg2+ and Co2+ transporter CorA
MEKSRTPTELPQPDFGRLHDLARHAIHISETFSLDINIAKDMILARSTLLKKEAGRPTLERRLNCSASVQDQQQFCLHMLECLSYRANSNHERLRNEIQLAFNMVTQHNARVSLDVSQSMRSDSSAMKTVAVLTLAFLPATFLSSVFSMSFFSFNAETGWAMSDRIWIYWAFSIPVTLLTTGLWFFWQRR